MHSTVGGLVLVAALCSFLLSHTVRGQVHLEAVQCDVTLPGRTDLISSIYVGEGRIYLFGGYTKDGRGADIYHLYNVFADTLSRVGELPSHTHGNALVEDSHGDLIHFGGWDLFTPFMDTIVRFNTSSGLTEVVGRLPKEMRTIGAVQHKADAALVFEEYDILEVNLNTFQVTQVGLMSNPSADVAWDGGDKVLLFHETEHQLYSISGNNLSNFNTSERHHFRLHHSVISTPKSAFVIGNRGSVAGRGHTIFEVDFQTLDFKFWPVDNYPALHDGDFYYAATTYVPELHRLYIFGGHDDGYLREYIWYIDLPTGNKIHT